MPKHSAIEGKHYSGKCTDTGLWLGIPGSGASVLMEYCPGSLVEMVEIITVLHLQGKVSVARGPRGGLWEKNLAAAACQIRASFRQPQRDLLLAKASQYVMLFVPL